jgi:hypothetical protein
MIKWFAYIVLLLIFAPGLSSAKIKTSKHKLVFDGILQPVLSTAIAADTLSAKKRQQQDEEKKKVKEISKAKRQIKPEKIDGADNVQDPKAKSKPRRERRPEGLERPPEIPRRNGN